VTLREIAVKVHAHAYAPYSQFKVGAAIRTRSGRVFSGCNVENVAYPEGTCAEAGAVAAMVAAGEREIVEIYIVSDGPKPASPCGGCRQKLAEFARGEVVVTLGTTHNSAEVRTLLSELLPGAFTPDQLEKND